MGVQRLGAASMPGRWRGRGGFYARQVARNFVAIAATRVNHGAILNQIVGGVQRRESRESNRGGSSMQGIPAFPVSLCLEGVSQMVYILPERLLALVRPAFDLVLRRIRSLKRCVQA